jgi:uncharacterized integral membrane protein
VNEIERRPEEPDEQDEGFWDGLEDRQRHQLRTLGWLVLIAILVLLFIVQNNDDVEVSFVIVKAKTSLIWLIVLSFVAGALSGHLLTRLVRRKMLRRPK